MFLIVCSAPLFTGCKGGGLPKINTQVYFKPTISSNILSSGISAARSLPLETITAQNADISKLDKYHDFKIESNTSYIYKMYIEKIEFYVFTNKSTSDEMIFTLKATNLAKENSLNNAATFTETKGIYAEANKAIKVTFKIEQTVALASGTTITIDISESNDLLLDKNSQNDQFKWLLYGFSVFGESREYSL